MSFCFFFLFCAHCCCGVATVVQVKAQLRIEIANSHLGLLVRVGTLQGIGGEEQGGRRASCKADSHVSLKHSSKLSFGFHLLPEGPIP